MKDEKLKTWIRIVLWACGVALFAVLFVPLWRIELDAPQYPEGLKLLIYPSKLAGNVDIINGLNHYIGMKTLHTRDFIEFTILPYIIAFFAFLFIVTGIAARRKWLYLLFVLFVLFGILAMYDFWRWEYDYGHNLNPDAAIIVPGMAYQPPLVGFKQLLNFGAYSIPDIGGWIFIIVGILMLSSILPDWRSKKKNTPGKSTSIVAGVISLISFNSCNSSPEPLKMGVDNCSFCKMTISDARFGAEIITKKGKIFKFDDIHCLLSFLKSEDVKTSEFKNFYFANYCNGHKLFDAKNAIILKADELRSPMGGNMAAFDNPDSMATVMLKYPGNTFNWNELGKQ